MFFSADGREVYHIGLIDYLQKWDISKRWEKWLKVKLMRRKWSNLSSVPARFYQKRFMDFMWICINNSQMVEEDDLDDWVSAGFHEYVGTDIRSLHTDMIRSVKTNNNKIE